MTTLIFAIIVIGQSNGVQTAPYLAAQMPGYKIINCAEGGTSSREWVKGKPLYDNCIRMIEAEGLPVAGIFHFQGERDSGNRKRATEWLSLTKSTLLNLRNDISYFNATHGWQAGTVPIVIAQLGPHPGDSPRPYWGYIQRQQAKLTTKIQDAYLITTSDITPYCDGPHWCSEGYAEIASRVRPFFQK